MSTNMLQKLRPCGRLETYSTARHHLGFYNNVGLTAIYTTSITLTNPLEDIVFSALHRVIAEHPNLSAISLNEEKHFPDVYFARLPAIDLRTCVEFYTRETPIPQGDDADGELDKVLREQHSRSFKSDVGDKPYWRLAISSSPNTPGTFSASWIFHHALSDGASSVLFHQSFLKALNVSMDASEINPIVQAPSTAPLPPLEDLHPMSLSWPFFLRAIAGSLLPSYFAPRPPNLWTGSPPNATAETPLSTHITSITFSSKTTKAFAVKCRSEKTSVTAALSVLLAASLSSTVAPGKDLKIDTPISLRPFLSISESQSTQMVNAISNHVSTFPATTELDESNHFSWATARRVKNELLNEVAKKGADNPIALLKYVSNIQDFFTGMLGQPRQSSAEVSNLGVWHGRSLAPAAEGVGEKSEGQWSLGRIVFSQSSNRTGPPISLSAVTGGDGCLVLSFNWADEDKAVEEGLSRVPHVMKDAIEQLVR
ncbi:hypothetical protein SVAN01_10847 [Stagonosporopsis vannaccii]|nr:hypothetical protein SVAN01_10847 [Stagonosporopsis vannaccii]